MNWMRGLLFCLLFFAGQVQAGEVEKSIQFNLNLSDTLCKSVSVGISFKAMHSEKGDRNGLLNERPWGKLGECFLDRKGHVYLLTGALENSQWCEALTHGIGFRAYTPNLWRFRLEGGYEFTFTYYRTGCAGGKYAPLMGGQDHKDIIAPLPMAYLGGSFEMPSVTQLMPREWAPQGPSWMNLPPGRLTVGMRLLGWPFAKKMAGENIKLLSVMYTQPF